MMYHNGIGIEGDADNLRRFTDAMRERLEPYADGAIMYPDERTLQFTTHAPVHEIVREVTREHPDISVQYDYTINHLAEYFFWYQAGKLLDMKEFGISEPEELYTLTPQDRADLDAQTDDEGEDALEQ